MSNNNLKDEFMSDMIRAGVIGCDMTEEFFQATASNKIEKFKWEKILVSNKITQTITKQYPEAQLVNDVEAIANDRNITLVIVSAKELEFVRPIIDSGKAVRVI